MGAEAAMNPNPASGSDVDVGSRNSPWDLSRYVECAVFHLSGARQSSLTKCLVVQTGAYKIVTRDCSNAGSARTTDVSLVVVYACACNKKTMQRWTRGFVISNISITARR